MTLASDAASAATLSSSAPDGAGAAIDVGALNARLDEILADSGSDTEKRARAVEILSEILADGRAEIEHDFHENRRPGQETARRLAALTDVVVIAAFRFAADGLHRLPIRTTGERLSMIAVGGYGRGEMAPFSDVDLLFLTPPKGTAWAETVVETTLYILWDLKLKVGHATRSATECVRQAQGDVTIRTALVERRLIAGDEGLAGELDERLWSDLFNKTGAEFVEAKLAERDARHDRTGGSRYLLEPNVKESKGGLRDLQTLLWIAKYLYHSDSFEELVERGVFTAEEAARCGLAAAHLWTVRCGLHYLAGRAQEKLTFDAQVELAERFGYRDRKGQRAVERFMKRYFIAAKEVGDLTRIFCAALEHQHKKSQPRLNTLRRLFMGAGVSEAVDEHFILRDGRLGLDDQELFQRKPTEMLRLISEAIRQNVSLHPTALRMIDRSRRLVDDSFRSDPEARKLFVDLVGSSRDPVRALRRMSETGLLGRMIPEFGRITSLMQFNMYHHYTVDEHTVVCIDFLMRIAAGKLKSDHPIESEIAVSLPDRRVITLALLLHDIGKGLPEDHSVAGERISREVCRDLDIVDKEAEQIVWLVRWHLLMSDVAQKRDLSDPATVAAFAEQVRSPTRLKLLYLLTACDIRGVGPGVWNGWKAQLLRQLYQETWSLLTGEGAGFSRKERVAIAQEDLRANLADWSDDAFAKHVERFFPGYWLGLTKASYEAHARLMQELAAHGAGAASEFKMQVAQSTERAATRVSFVMQDHPGLFARMSGALALVGASVVDARAYTTKDGIATNTFWVQDSEGDTYDDPSRLAGLKDAVERTLKGEIVPRDALRERRKLKPREQSFEVAPSVVFDNDASDLYTVIEVNGRDRVGLLYDLSRALAGENVNIASAIIATYGEHAVDVFYAKDLFGMKITSPTKQRRIEKTLHEALERSGLSQLKPVA